MSAILAFVVALVAALAAVAVPLAIRRRLTQSGTSFREMGETMRMKLTDGLLKGLRFLGKLRFGKKKVRRPVPYAETVAVAPVRATPPTEAGPAEETETVSVAPVGATPSVEASPVEAPETEPATRPVAIRSAVYENVKPLKTRRNARMIGWLIVQLLIVLGISQVAGFVAGGWQGPVQGLAIWVLIEGSIALLIKPVEVPSNTAWGIECFGLRVAIAREGLNILMRWEKLSTRVNAEGKRVPWFVTPEVNTFILKVPEVVQDSEIVTFSAELTFQHETVWTDVGISAALYGYAGDIEVHLEESGRSAMADYAGVHSVVNIPSCQAELQDYTMWYFMTIGLPADYLLYLRETYLALPWKEQKKYEPGLKRRRGGEKGIGTIPPFNWLVKNGINGFASRFGHRLTQVQYKGIGGEFLAALASKKVKAALADGVREEASGEADATRTKGKAAARVKIFEANAEAIRVKRTGKAAADVKRIDAEAEVYRITETGEAEAYRRLELAQADADRVYEVMVQMAGSPEVLKALSDEERARCADRAWGFIRDLDYNAAVRTSDGSQKAVVFAAKPSVGSDLDDAAQRSVVAQILNKLITVGKSTDKPSDVSAAVAAAQP